MRARVSIAWVLAVVAASAGCVTSWDPIEPGPSRGEWTTTEGDPWFAYFQHVGFCGAPPCASGVVLFDDGYVLWFSWGRNGGWDAEAERETHPGLEVPDERMRDALARSLLFVGEDLDNRVYDVRTGILPHRQAEAVTTQILADARHADDPGIAAMECDDASFPNVAIIHGTVSWRVTLAGRQGGCGQNEDPQEEWFRIEEQGRALRCWLSPRGCPAPA